MEPSWKQYNLNELAELVIDEYFGPTPQFTVSEVYEHVKSNYSLRFEEWSTYVAEHVRAEEFRIELSWELQRQQYNARELARQLATPVVTDTTVPQRPYPVDVTDTAIMEGTCDMLSRGELPGVVVDSSEQSTVDATNSNKSNSTIKRTGPYDDRPSSAQVLETWLFVCGAGDQYQVFDPGDCLYDTTFTYSPNSQHELFDPGQLQLFSRPVFVLMTS